jgi:hypothetical protein
MLIKSIEVKNFRSIREAYLDCDNLTAIVGRNGAGKSSFLYAIDTFYDIAAPITEEDFFDRDVGSPIEIRVTYGDLREDEKEEFSPYIRDDRLIVTKRISSENGRITQRYYAAALQIPRFAEIRAKPSKRDRVNAWNELVDSGEFADLDGRPRSADEVERLMSEYEADHPELMKPIEREEQFFGPRNIGGGKLDKFTKYVLVPAVRETWAVFKENLEEILKETLGNDTFQSIQKEVASELGYDDPERVSKNIEGASHFIELVYEKEHRIPILEEIIEKVTQLSSGEN